VEHSTILDRSPTDLAREFNALADPARQAILAKLRGGSRCLCELETDLGLASNLLSYHMRLLREAGLVSRTRHGRRVHYALKADGLERLRRGLDWLAQGEVTS
jgi:ArsR family transcriptional regulator